MGVTNAEKQKKYQDQINSDPIKRAEYLQKRRNAYKIKKEVGKVLNISHLGRRDAKKQRNDWKERQQKCRKNKRLSQTTVFDCLLEDGATPIIPIQLDTSFSELSSRQKYTGAKIRRKDRAACYRQNRLLKDELEKKNRMIEMYRKRNERLLKTKYLGIKLSPLSTVQKRFKNRSVPKDIKRSLVFHETVMQSLQEKYANLSSPKQKRHFLTSLDSAGKILKKYKMKKMLYVKLGISKAYVSYLGGLMSTFLPKLNKNLFFKEKIHAFYIRDDNSRITNGKKLTITRKKIKMQKRLLNDTMIILHKKFLTDNPNLRISYTGFTQLRPFWVIPPTEKDRDTCMCKICENPRLLLEKVKQLKLTGIQSLGSIPRVITCNEKSQDCAYNICAECKDQQVPLEISNTGNNEDVSVLQWVTKKDEREKLNVNGTLTKIIVQQSMKKEETITLDALNHKFQLSATKYTKHLFNIIHQYRQFKWLKENLQPTECLLQIDFSENFTLKYAFQVQQAHFGASLQQVSLHTSVVHLPDQTTPLSFCSISPNLQHGPPAIWKHLNPVLNFIHINYPNISKIHFYSDGPVTQYKQKGNFFLLAIQIYELGFVSATWNFWESGHGRGAPDGVGGAIKRRADEMVRHGIDLNTAQVLFDRLQESETSIKLFFITEKDIISAYKTIPNLKPVPRTMSIHQVITTSPGIIMYRNLSCFCSHPETFNCNCYKLESFSFLPIARNISADVYIHPEGEPHKSQIEETYFLNNSNSRIETPGTITEELVDKWVVIKYIDNYYPGKILSVKGEEVVVSCLSYSGNHKVNKFFWPKKKDVTSYRLKDIITLMSEPNRLYSGHLEMPSDVWKELNRKI